MNLRPLNTHHRLLDIFAAIKPTQPDVACISGFGESWQNLLAYDCIDRFVLTDITDLSGLVDFINKHQSHLVVGYFSYDLGLALHELPSQFEPQMPLIQLHAYDRFILDMPGGLQGHAIEQTELDKLIESVQLTKPGIPEIVWSDDMPMSDYLTGFETIQDYIRAGDIYQINYTHQLQGKTTATGRELFFDFMNQKPVSHAAYFDAGEQEIISLSPEGFIRIDSQHIVTQPIKGTRPRHSETGLDAALRDELVQSKKEQAELFMIVDLLRNDLGKVCKTNSVKVTDPKVVTAMPNVWHTHANIEGQLKDDIPVIEALISMFPGGSITGCPKHRAMEIIDELETEPRGVYTGSLGYILPDGKAAFNIAIRTLVKSGEHIQLGVGGGITIKSEGEDEYAETAAKAAFFRGTNK